MFALLPFLAPLPAKSGAVRANPENAERLLRKGELVGVFPEGVKGVGKRYQGPLQARPLRARWLRPPRPADGRPHRSLRDRGGGGDPPDARPRPTGSAGRSASPTFRSPRPSPRSGRLGLSRCPPSGRSTSASPSSSRPSTARSGRRPDPREPALRAGARRDPGHDRRAARAAALDLVRLTWPSASSTSSRSASGRPARTPSVRCGRRGCSRWRFRSRAVLERTTAVRVELFGSLGATGPRPRQRPGGRSSACWAKPPKAVDVGGIPARVRAVRREHALDADRRAGPSPFVEARAALLLREEPALPPERDALSAIDAAGAALRVARLLLGRRRLRGGRGRRRRARARSGRTRRRCPTPSTAGTSCWPCAREHGLSHQRS